MIGKISEQTVLKAIFKKRQVVILFQLAALKEWDLAHFVLQRVSLHFHRSFLQVMLG